MTTTEQSQQSVRRTVTVDAPIEKAFRVFTEGFDTWWLRTHKIGGADLSRAVLECREGGRWYEVDIDGTECDWGRVLVWEPPARVVLAWQIDATWQYDAELVTEVEVRFSAEGPSQTRVDLEHRNLDRLGDAREEFAKAIGGDGGWNSLLAHFAAAAAGAKA
jgi:uncharacterized protein YndB with AHSA1/START domain